MKFLVETKRILNLENINKSTKSIKQECLVIVGTMPLGTYRPWPTKKIYLYNQIVDLTLQLPYKLNFQIMSLLQKPFRN